MRAPIERAHARMMIECVLVLRLFQNLKLRYDIFSGYKSGKTEDGSNIPLNAGSEFIIGTVRCGVPLHRNR